MDRELKNDSAMARWVMRSDIPNFSMEAAGFLGTRPSVSVIIPTLNEAKNLPLVLPYLPMDWIDEVLLVDGRSSDNTVETAQRILPSIKVVLETKKGKGAAMYAGYKAASGDILVVMDADGSNDPRESPRYVKPLLEGADFVKGSRFSLAVEIALETVADRLVQQHAGPARAEHDGHLAGRRRSRFEVGQRRVDRLVDVRSELCILEVPEAEAPAAPARSDFAPPVGLGDHGDRQPHQRSHVGRTRAVGARDQHHVVLGRDPGHHLHHPRVARARHALDLLQQRDLLRAVEGGDRDRKS